LVYTIKMAEWLYLFSFYRRRERPGLPGFLLLLLLLFARTAGAENPGDAGRGTDGHAEKPAVQRVITLSPAITEIVFALGAGDRVVATSDFCTFPPEASTREKVGGAINPNFEKMTALRPTLIIIQGENEQVADFCAMKKIPVFRVKLDTMADIKTAIRKIGRRIGRPETAEALVGEIGKKIAAVQSGIAAYRRPRVFLCLHHMPGSLARLTTVGPSSFFQEAVKLAGGDNIYSDLKILYPTVSKESLVKRRPDIIVEMLYDPSMDGAGRQRLIEDWQKLSMIPAVRHGRVVLLDDDFSLIPGPRIHLLVEKLARIFHPRARFSHE